MSFMVIIFVVVWEIISDSLFSGVLFIHSTGAFPQGSLQGCRHYYTFIGLRLLSYAAVWESVIFVWKSYLKLVTDIGFIFQFLEISFITLFFSGVCIVTKFPKLDLNSDSLASAPRVPKEQPALFVSFHFQSRYMSLLLNWGTFLVDNRQLDLLL